MTTQSLDLISHPDTAIESGLDRIKNVPALTKEDSEWLVGHSEHLNHVMKDTFIWRTEEQKLSIISDGYHPTTHSKFHQAILEQKVQFGQLMYLGKDYEMKKLEAEELMLDIEDAKKEDTPRSQIRQKKLELELKFKQYELNQMHIQMTYRMKEVKGWQNIEESLMKAMEKDGLSIDEIWNKERGEIVTNFKVFLTNLKGIEKTTDGGEYQNLINLAIYGIQRARQVGAYDELVKTLNADQLRAIHWLKERNFI